MVLSNKSVTVVAELYDLFGAKLCDDDDRDEVANSIRMRISVQRVLVIFLRDYESNLRDLWLLFKPEV